MLFPSVFLFSPCFHASANEVRHIVDFSSTLVVRTEYNLVSVCEFIYEYVFHAAGQMSLEYISTSEATS